MAAVCDDEFVEVGNKAGLCIWRIENFKLIKQKSNEFGKIKVIRHLNIQFIH